MLLAICMMAGIVNAQKMYIRLGVGGGVGLAQYVGTNWGDGTSTGSFSSMKIKSYSLGGGFNVNPAVGFMLSDHVGIELGVNEFIGLSKKEHLTSTSGTQDDKVSGMMLQLVPAIVITPGLEKVNPYARLGIIVGILPSITEKTNSTFSSGGEQLEATFVEDYKDKLSGGVALGFTAAGGADFSLGDHFSIFGEVVFNGITYAPKKGKIKTWTENGIDMLATATPKEKEWTYEKNVDNTTIPDVSKNKLPKTSFNFSNFELNIGVKIKL